MELLRDSRRRMSSSVCSSSLQRNLLDEETQIESMSEAHSRKPGWKAMPYIIGNNTVERLATFGMQANLAMYLIKVYNMDQVFAANIINTWSAVSYVVPLIGAFLADAYIGKFRTIAIASFANLTGMVVVMLTTWVPHIHPEPCTLEQQHAGVCKGHTSLQLGVLIFGLSWLSIGTGGIRPCSIPFAVDQFDMNTPEGRRGATKFINIYYISLTLTMLFNQTLLVYIMESVSWTLGYALPIVFMPIAIVFLFAGTGVYSYVKPEGSIFSKIVQVLVAATHKRHIHLPALADNSQLAFYDPPLEKDEELKLPLTNNFRCLNKAAVLAENELNMDESNRDPWRLCSIQQVEELKCLLKIMPIWLSTIIIYLPVVQQSVFPASQATKMDCHLGHFKIPPASITTITLLSTGLFLPLYDSVMAPLLEKITNQEGGLTVLQRISLGHGCGILSMVFAGLIERRRRQIAVSIGSPDGIAPMSVMWLAPQSILVALIHVFADVGQTLFFNKESPDGMRSTGNSLLCLSFSGASNLSNIIINIVHNFTGKNDQPDWLNSDINKGRLENFYFIIAGLMMLNMIYFIFCARGYAYKTIVKA